MLSTAPGTLMVDLEKIDIRNVLHIIRVSISGQYLCSLKSLHLEDLKSLIEVKLGKYAKSNREGCPGRQCCLKTISVYACSMLHKFEAIEELKGYLLFQAGFRNMWQDVLSHVTYIILEVHFWEPSCEMKKNFKESIVLSVDLFNGLDVRVTKIPDDPEAGLWIPVTEETSAVVIFVIVNCGRQKDWIEFLGVPPSMMVRRGFEHVHVAVVVREKEKMNQMLLWIRLVVCSGVDVVSMVTFGKREKIRGELFLDFCNRVFQWRLNFLEYQKIKVGSFAGGFADGFEDRS